MQNYIIKDIDQAIFANICMGLRDAHKYEENKRKIKIGKEIGKRKVCSRYSRSFLVILSIPVLKRTMSDIPDIPVEKSL